MWEFHGDHHTYINTIKFENYIPIPTHKLVLRIVILHRVI